MLIINSKQSAVEELLWRDKLTTAWRDLCHFSQTEASIKTDDLLMVLKRQKYNGWPLKSCTAFENYYTS